MKFGIFDQLDATGQPLNLQYEQRLALAELYDRCGFHAYHQSEHHATPLNLAPSQNVFLAALTQRTRQLRLCPLVYLLPVHHPMRLAEEICMLDHLSQGRFEFGVGRGASPYELQSLGMPPERAQAAYVEAFDILQQYFASEVLDHVGEFWTIRDTPVTMKPLQRPHPPMWYAAATADSVAWPARQGMNILCGGPVAQVRALSDRYRAEASQAIAETGTKARSDALVGVSRFVVVADTDAQALAIAERAWPRFYDNFYKLWRKHGTEPARLKLATDFAGMVAAGQGVAGSPATVIAALERQARDGRLNYLVGQFMFGDLPHEDAVRSVSLFASAVMPALRAASGEWL
jgi:alkanesulfonate monooxygenase SsuD/methylene tetrahydromethanopterin reductase-like flavin-dependent oxidoreductase (luciferase family)